MIRPSCKTAIGSGLLIAVFALSTRASFAITCSPEQSLSRARELASGVAPEADGADAIFIGRVLSLGVPIGTGGTDFGYLPVTFDLLATFRGSPSETLTVLSTVRPGLTIDFAPDRLYFVVAGQHEGGPPMTTDACAGTMPLTESEVAALTSDLSGEANRQVDAPSMPVWVYPAVAVLLFGGAILLAHRLRPERA